MEDKVRPVHAKILPLQRVLTSSRGPQGSCDMLKLN